VFEHMKGLKDLNMCYCFITGKKCRALFFTNQSSFEQVSDKLPLLFLSLKDCSRP